jgi:hypothetical protein
MQSPGDPAKPHRPSPEQPRSPEQPVTSPDDPNAPHVDREPNFDPPPTAPPVPAPSERPVITEPPTPHGQSGTVQSRAGFTSSIWILAAALLSAVTLSAQAPADPVTVQLRNGQTVSGSLEDLEGGTLYIRVSLHDQRKLPLNEVALIDRVGGASGLPETELREARKSEHVAFLTTGTSITGTLVDIVGGPGSGAQDAAAARDEDPKERRFIFRLTDGSTREVPGNQIGRVYLGSFEHQTSTTSPSPGVVPSGAIQVPGNAEWVATGLSVTQGQRVGFSVTGQVRLSTNPDDVASSAGASRLAPAGSPMPGIPAGALLGRIGANGAPFAIGNQTTVAMPGAGPLYLGVNDDERSDNTGAFVVTIGPGATQR